MALFLLIFSLMHLSAGAQHTHGRGAMSAQGYGEDGLVCLLILARRLRCRPGRSGLRALCRRFSNHCAAGVKKFSVNVPITIQ
jgi:hypothetical protein